MTTGPARARSDLTLSTYVAVFLLSLAVLMVQIALNRIFSYTIWYHFAYISISLALLGFGASGSMLAAFPRLGSRDLPETLGACGALSAIATVAMFVLIGTVPLDPFHLFESVGEMGRFALHFVAVTIPFFFSGLAIAVALRAAGPRVGKLYFWDLCGAGLGCALIVGAIDWLETPRVILVVALVFALAGIVGAGSRARRVRNVNAGVALFVLMLMGPLPGALPFTPSLDKEISKWLALGNLQFTRWSAVFRTDVLGMKEGEMRLGGYGEVGISPRFVGEKPPFRMIVHDGGAGAILYRVAPDLSDLDMFRHHILTAPYVMRPGADVLVIGVGGGADVVTALANGAASVTGVELDPITVQLITEDLADFSGRIYDRPNVSIHVGEGRHFLRSASDLYDVIQLSGVDTLAALSSGAYNLAENYLYTVEAYRDYFSRLRPDGILSISGMDHHPVRGAARHTSRFAALSYEALRGLGVERPQDHVMIIGTKPAGWPLAQIMTKKTPFTAEEIAAMEAFIEANDFQAWYLPGREDNLYDAFRIILEGEPDERAAFFRETFLDLRATTDDRPFFFSYYKWRHLFAHRYEIDQGHTLATGQLVLVVILVTAVLLSALAIALPLLRARRGVAAMPGRGGFLLYFGALGGGFILLEISFVQRFIIFLGHPTYSLSVLLFAFLTSAGFGAYASGWLPPSPGRVLPALAATLTVLLGVYAAALPSVFDAFLHAPLPARIAVAVVLCAPLGALLGMFFPFGLRLTSDVNADFVAWAWAANGCLTVVGSVASIIIATSFGFRVVTLLALCIYWTGVWSFARTWRRVEVTSVSRQQNSDIQRP